MAGCTSQHLPSQPPPPQPPARTLVHPPPHRGVSAMVQSGARPPPSPTPPPTPPTPTATPSPRRLGNGAEWELGLGGKEPEGALKAGGDPRDQNARVPLEPLGPPIDQRLDAGQVGRPLLVVLWWVCGCCCGWVGVVGGWEDGRGGRGALIGWRVCARECVEGAEWFWRVAGLWRALAAHAHTPQPLLNPHTPPHPKRSRPPSSCSG